MSSTLSPAELRRKIRAGEHTGNTSGLAPGFVQCNIVILPADSAHDFLRFCQLNPKPCPLLAVGERGAAALPTLGEIDIRTDVPALPGVSQRRGRRGSHGYHRPVARRPGDLRPGLFLFL